MKAILVLLFMLMSSTPHAQIYWGSISQTVPTVGNNLGVTGWASYADTSYTNVTPRTLTPTSDTLLTNNAIRVL